MRLSRLDFAEKTGNKLYLRVDVVRRRPLPKVWWDKLHLNQNSTRESPEFYPNSGHCFGKKIVQDHLKVKNCLKESLNFKLSEYLPKWEDLELEKIELPVPGKFTLLLSTHC